MRDVRVAADVELVPPEGCGQRVAEAVLMVLQQRGLRGTGGEGTAEGGNRSWP